MRGGLRYLNPAFWRSELVSTLHKDELILLLYLLAGPSVNLLGMVHVSRHIMMAECRLAEDEFDVAMSRLAAREIVVAVSGRILLRNWWDHNKWKSILRGKCRPLAAELLMDAPPVLRRAWVDASVNAGVPAAVVTAFVVEAGLDLGDAVLPVHECPIDGASLLGQSPICRDETTTTDSDRISAATTTNPTAHVIGGHDHTTKEDAADQFSLELEAISEPHRNLILEECKQLPIELRQAVADEFTQRLVDADSNTGPAIANYRAWLSRVAAEALAQRLSPGRGAEVAKRRSQRLHAAQQDARRNLHTDVLTAHAVRRREEALAKLSALSSPDQSVLVEQVVSSIGERHREAARAALYGRTSLGGHLASIVIPALKTALDEHSRSVAAAREAK